MFGCRPIRHDLYLLIYHLRHHDEFLRPVLMMLLFLFLFLFLQKVSKSILKLVTQLGRQS